MTHVIEGKVNEKELPASFNCRKRGAVIVMSWNNTGEKQQVESVAPC